MQTINSSISKIKSQIILLNDNKTVIENGKFTTQETMTINRYLMDKDINRLFKEFKEQEILNSIKQHLNDYKVKQSIKNEKRKHDLATTKSKRKIEEIEEDKVLDKINKKKRIQQYMHIWKIQRRCNVKGIEDFKAFFWNPDEIKNQILSQKDALEAEKQLKIDTLELLKLELNDLKYHNYTSKASESETPQNHLSENLKEDLELYKDSLVSKIQHMYYLVSNAMILIIRICSQLNEDSNVTESNITK